MRSVGIFEVKTKLSELLRIGEPIEITSHRKSVAVIYPKHQRDLKQIKQDAKEIKAADLLDNTADFGDYV